MTEHEFHKQRRMYAIHEGRLLLAEAEDVRSHADWLRQDHGIPEPGTRGYYDGTGLYVYGKDFQATGVELRQVLPHVPAIVQSFGCDVTLPLWLGVKPQSKPGRWHNRGPISKFL